MMHFGVFPPEWHNCKSENVLANMRSMLPKRLFATFAEAKADPFVRKHGIADFPPDIRSPSRLGDRAKG
jgi:hypothetical protein